MKSFRLSSFSSDVNVVATRAWRQLPAFRLVVSQTPVLLKAVERRSLGQGKRDVDPSTSRSTRVAQSACGDHDILSPADFVCNRRGNGRERQLRFPAQLPCGLVIGSEFFIADTGSDKEHSSSRNHRAAVILRARVKKAFGDQFRILSKRFLPQVFPTV